MVDLVASRIPKEKRRPLEREEKRGDQQIRSRKEHRIKPNAGH